MISLGLMSLFIRFIIEVAIIALFTSIIGIGIGFLIQRILPLLLQDFLVVDVDFMLAPDAIIIGLLVGVITTILFTISPLLASKNISPISAINASDNTKTGKSVKWLSRLGITLFVIIFAYGQTGCGKTWTMQGMNSPPELRGVIPISFDHIFQNIKADPQTQFLVRCSYLEVCG